MIENTQNSFEKYIGLFIFYIIPIHYPTFMCQILIFGPNWIQNAIAAGSKTQLSQIINDFHLSILDKSRFEIRKRYSFLLRWFIIEIIKQY